MEGEAGYMLCWPKLRKEGKRNPLRNPTHLTHPTQHPEEEAEVLRKYPVPGHHGNWWQRLQILSHHIRIHYQGSANSAKDQTVNILNLCKLCCLCHNQDESSHRQHALSWHGSVPRKQLIKIVVCFMPINFFKKVPGQIWPVGNHWPSIALGQERPSLPQWTSSLIELRTDELLDSAQGPSCDRQLQSCPITWGTLIFHRFFFM